MKIPQNKLAPSDTGGDVAGPADYSATKAALCLSVPSECGGLRLDQVLARLCPQHSRSRLQQWVREGSVTIDGARISEPKHKLWGGESVEIIERPDPHLLAAKPENISLNVVYEDEALIVVDKPAGLVVHPGSGNWSGTLLNALLHHAPELERVPRAGIVHRLDKDTSGLLVVARTLEAQTDLVRQLQARTMKRYYYALVRGVLERGGTVDAPMGRHPSQRTKMAIVQNGKPARTHYRIVERFLDCTLVECALETGRTHQIRVHMTSIGHPLVGDPVYGGGASRIPGGPAFPRQALHARRLGLVHPVTLRPMLWKSELPDDLRELIENARSEAYEARLMEEEAEDDWDEDDFADGPELIYVRGDGSEDDDDDLE